MLTIFAVPKAFSGHFKVIQENAIANWTKLRPKPEIILFGDEKGSGQIARKYSLAHIKKVQKNDKGTPLLSDIFEKAQAFSKNPILAYVNADIILFGNFPAIFHKINLERFLITGQRWNLNVNQSLEFAAGWQKRLMAEIIAKSQLDQLGALDYFIFPKTIDFKMPPFAVGRGVWDNWLIYKAKFLKIPVIDATDVISAIHQKHDYSHAGGYQAVWYGLEREENLRIAKDKKRPFNLINADWILDSKGLSRPKFSIYRAWRNLQVYPVVNPESAFLVWPSVLLLEFLIKIYQKFLK